MQTLTAPHRRTWSSVALRAAALVTGLVTPLLGLSAWLLFADPALAADVATSRDLLPLVEAMVDVLSTVLEHTLALL